jgi:hypothetical protein
MAKLRMALTISGAVSLGAYEAGVLAGLLASITPVREYRMPSRLVAGSRTPRASGTYSPRHLDTRFDRYRQLACCPKLFLSHAWACLVTTPRTL